jgi:hypothetical protein
MQVALVIHGLFLFANLLIRDAMNKNIPKFSMRGILVVIPSLIRDF